MALTYRVDIGLATVLVDEYGVSFDQTFDGNTMVCFSDGKITYKILACSLVSINFDTGIRLLF